MENHDITFEWPHFDLMHNNVLVDVYQNNLFDYRVKQECKNNSINISILPKSSSVFVKVYPDNDGSIYNEEFYLSDTIEATEGPLRPVEPSFEDVEVLAPSIESITRSVINSDDNFIYIKITPIFGVIPQYLLLKFYYDKNRTKLMKEYKTHDVHSALIKYPRGESSYLSIYPFTKEKSGKKFIYNNIFNYHYI